jgi:hypothetical protein
MEGSGPIDIWPRAVGHKEWRGGLHYQMHTRESRTSTAQKLHNDIQRVGSVCGLYQLCDKENWFPQFTAMTWCHHNVSYVDAKWYSSYPELQECHDPGQCYLGMMFKLTHFA